jgi:hypothetical protein
MIKVLHASPGLMESAATVADTVLRPLTYVHAGVAEDIVGKVASSAALPNYLLAQVVPVAKAH